MSKYKIRINCTSEEDLSYNTNKKICKRDKEKYNFDDINYINQVYVLYKILENKPFTLKTLEFKTKNRGISFDIQ